MESISVPRLQDVFSVECLNNAILRAFVQLGYDKPSDDQYKAIKEFVLGRDVFVSLPTGAGKSLCYAALPYVFDNLIKYQRVAIDAGETSGNSKRSIVIVVSPLLTLMNDQITKFGQRGLKCLLLGKSLVSNTAVVRGDYQLLYLTPECLLQELSLRELFRSSVYRENLVAFVVGEAHCIDAWGESFRKEFQCIGEIRSIINRDINVMALTATATCHVRKVIESSLCMVKCSAIIKVPNKLNIKYIVERKPDNLNTVLLPIVSGIQFLGKAADKYIIFCRTYSDAVLVHERLADQLGLEGSLFIDGDVTCELFTASSHENDKTRILAQFTKMNTSLKVIVVIVAFGMGIDVPDIRHVIHWGPPSSIAAYVQESGRCGRDGTNATATLYYTPTDFSGFHPPAASIKEYCYSVKQCRREVLMAEFDSSSTCIKQPIPDHSCCDVCTQTCVCIECSKHKEAPLLCTPSGHEPPVNSHITSEQQQVLRACLEEYRLSLFPDLSEPILFGIQVATGITDSLIHDIASNPYHYDLLKKLLDCGLSQVHAQFLYDIIKNFL